MSPRSFDRHVFDEHATFGEHPFVFDANDPVTKNASHLLKPNLRRNGAASSSQLKGCGLEAALFFAVDALREDEVLMEFHPHVVIRRAHDAGEHVGLSTFKSSTTGSEP
jgi:hypothetical protein